ncbi:mitochondrial thiamine pyrophosphate carrier-like [Brevipalpus obovatus]|uniref:mitochondrial thiamine pyrophosphate carrier-like n=1 Tax=Brevipalpus obovatus TaxID=246614 RepID=UPI003D9DC03F
MVRNRRTRSSLDTLDYTLVGFLTGITTRFLTQPLEVIKIRFQLQVEPINYRSPKSKYKSIAQCRSLIIREEGFHSLWKGHLASQTWCIIHGSTQFLGFELLTRRIYRDFYVRSDFQRFLIDFACGAFSGGIASMVSMPMDVLQTRFVAQTEPRTILNLRHAFKYIYQNEGIAGFYRGTFPAVLQILPHAGLLLSSYRVFNNIWEYFDEPAPTFLFRRGPSAPQIFICGGMSGIVAKATIYPLDLVKRRLQVQGFGHARKNLGEVPNYTGLLDCIKQIIHKESFYGLFKGLKPSILKAFLGTGSHFLLYGQSVEFLIDTM